MLYCNPFNCLSVYEITKIYSIVLQYVTIRIKKKQQINNYFYNILLHRWGRDLLFIVVEILEICFM